MTNPDANGTLVAYYRAVGKPAYGHKLPTHSTDCMTNDEALAIGAALVEAGTWDEFYVKVVHRARRGRVVDEITT